MAHLSTRNVMRFQDCLSTSGKPTRDFPSNIAPATLWKKALQSWEYAGSDISRTEMLLYHLKSGWSCWALQNQHVFPASCAGVNSAASHLQVLQHHVLCRELTWQQALPFARCCCCLSFNFARVFEVCQWYQWLLETLPEKPVALERRTSQLALT